MLRFFQKDWKPKLACALGVLAYNVTGYFFLNRFRFERYFDVPRVAVFDDLPLLPWTIVPYVSVYVLVGLGIWLLPDRTAMRRYFLSTALAFTITYVFFALWPTRMDRAPFPESSMWSWALRLTREIDQPNTCFPSLHITNCTLAVVAAWPTRWRWWFLAWSFAVAASTLTTDQHYFLDIPSGAATGLMGAVLVRGVLGRMEDRTFASRPSADENDLPGPKPDGYNDRQP